MGGDLFPAPAAVQHLSFFRGYSPFFLLQGVIVSEQVWQEMKKTSEKTPTCPDCGSQRLWKDGSKKTPKGRI
jgi:DNA-directed RNA polymerase subunit RPC12/RpoP